jgi:hypothetical protein
LTAKIAAPRRSGQKIKLQPKAVFPFNNTGNIPTRSNSNSKSEQYLCWQQSSASSTYNLKVTRVKYASLPLPCRLDIISDLETV